MKNVLLFNAVSAFKESLEKISITFKNTEIMVGHISGELNLSDYLTKLYPDPEHYRIGPDKFNSFATLEEDIVARCRSGTFEYLGLPSKFVQEQQPRADGSCQVCTEFCGLVLTRKETKKKEKTQNKEEVVKAKDPKTQQAKKLQQWWAWVRSSFTLGNGENLLNVNYVPQCKLVLSRKEYVSLKSKFFTLQKFFNVCCLLVARWKARELPLHPICIKSEAFYLLLKTSQNYHSTDLSKLGDFDIHGIKCMSLRLHAWSAREIFNTNFLPVIESGDDILMKFVRAKHEISSSSSRSAHHTKKTTLQNVLRGEVGITWYKKRTHINSYVLHCGVCNKFKSDKGTPPMRKMLVRVNPSMKPWTHVSIDPLGLVRVKKGAGGNTKINPLIICDVNGGITTFEIINSLEAKEVYLALLMVEYRYATKIT